MRNVNVSPKLGDLRVQKKFLWLPLTITSHGDKGQIVKERRWLETVHILERWSQSVPISCMGHFWYKIRFLTDKEIHISEKRNVLRKILDDANISAPDLNVNCVDMKKL